MNTPRSTGRVPGNDAGDLRDGGAPNQRNDKPRDPDPCGGTRPPDGRESHAATAASDSRHCCRMPMPPLRPVCGFSVSLALSFCQARYTDAVQLVGITGQS